MDTAKRGLSVAAMACAAFITGCIERPADEVLRPPPGIQRALGALGQEGRATSERLLAEARRESQRLVRRAAPAAAPALARAIRHAERQAARSGAKPLPDAIRRQLAPYFDTELLAKVRWTIGTGRVDLGTFLTDQYMDEGAVALDTQIVFSSERLTRNIWIWAHELGHVEQYRRLGIDGFAAAYVTDWQKMEREATVRANRVTAAIRANGK